MSASKVLKLIAIMVVATLGFCWGSTASAQVSGCIQCHTDESRLKAITDKLGPRGATMDGKAPMPRYKRVLVEKAFLEDENHGKLGCQECHKGNPDNVTFETAHDGVVLEPSFPAAASCADCHDKETENYRNGLHHTIRGMKKAIEVRVNPDPAVRERVHQASIQCARCHGTCGQCHVKRPIQQGGGLLSGHFFKGAASMTDSCQGCHTSLVSEYMGRTGGAAKPDIHFELNEYKCQDCHTEDQFHGGKKSPGSMYDKAEGPTCVSCHEEIYMDKGENKKIHGMHKDKVSCQVCHAQAYTNCASCHLTRDWGKDKYKSWIDFKIGLNPNQSEAHPERMVTLRHVPVTPNMFDEYVADGLTNFDAAPTWKMTTPHNIRRKTTQNSNCNNCHGYNNRKLYLMRGDVEPDLRKANRPVMVPPARVPGPIKD
ncbi:MAG: hypothetical protein KKB20_25150 [Proteobacteria bacterium]|nr:hypothetical protein [Pseudomonadota bacterium]